MARGRGAAGGRRPQMMRSSAPPWASPRTRASKCGTASSSDPCTTRAGGQPGPGAAVDGRMVRNSRLQASCDGGKSGEVIRARSRAVEDAAGVVGPVVEVGRHAEGGDPPPRVGAPADAQRAAGAEPCQPHGPHPIHRLQVVDGGVHVVQPPGQREVALGLARPRKLNVRTIHPMSMAIRSPAAGTTRQWQRRWRSRSGTLTAHAGHLPGAGRARWAASGSRTRRRTPRRLRRVSPTRSGLGAVVGRMGRTRHVGTCGCVLASVSGPKHR